MFIQLQMAKELEEAGHPLLDPSDHIAASELEAGSSHVNIQREIYTHPDQAVRWLISRGVLRLGSFKVQVR